MNWQIRRRSSQIHHLLASTTPRQLRLSQAYRHSVDRKIGYQDRFIVPYSVMAHHILCMRNQSKRTSRIWLFFRLGHSRTRRHIPSSLAHPKAPKIHTIRHTTAMRERIVYEIKTKTKRKKNISKEHNKYT